MIALYLFLVFINPCLSQNQDFRCGFKDEDFLPNNKEEGGGGPLFEGAIETCCRNTTKWENDIVVYYFDPDFPEIDKRIVKSQMKKIKENTCITFKELLDPDPNDTHLHRLKIHTKDTQEKIEQKWYNNKWVKYKPCNWGRVSTHRTKKEFALELNGDGTEECKPGLVMHELMHTLGMLHTIKRPDRDDFVTVNDECIPNNRKGDYKKFNESTADLFNVPYKCKSIMHYPNYKSFRCDAVTAKNCPDGFGFHDYSSPLKEDWLLLKKEHCDDGGDVSPNGA